MLERLASISVPRENYARRRLVQAILNDRCQIAKAANATVITLDEAPKVGSLSAELTE